MTNTVFNPQLSFDGASAVLAAAVDAARRTSVEVCVAVCDLAGDAIVTARMDGAPRLSAQIALNKAWTVAGFNGMPTSMWWGAIKDDPSLVHGITHTPRLTIFAGGVPVVVDGAVVGSVGVSGGSAEQDNEIASAAAAVVAYS